MTTTRDELRKLRDNLDRVPVAGMASIPHDTARLIVDALDQLDAAEHRATRAEAQAAIRGRAVAIYRERAREAEARIEAVEAMRDKLHLNYTTMSGPAVAAALTRALDGDA